MNLLGLISHLVFFPLSLYMPIADLSFFNPIIKSLAGGEKYERADFNPASNLEYIRSNKTVGQVCVYYERSKWLKAKSHMILVELDNGSYVVYKYGPPDTGYFPLDEPVEGRFIAYRD